MNLWIDLLIAIASLACFGILFVIIYTKEKYFYPIENYPPIKLTSLELGVFEGKVMDLYEVIVLADIIEKPESTLFTSIEANFKRNVKYTFFISKSNYVTECNSYYLFFQAMMRATNRENCLTITSLAMDWNTYPYIFYRTKKGDKLTTHAYRGTEIKNGIADNYVLLRPELAETIANIINQAIINTNEKSLETNKIPTLNNEEFNYQKINLN